MRVELPYEVREGHLAIQVPADAVPRGALVGALYDLLDQAHVVLLPHEEGIEVRLEPLAPGPAEGLLEALAERVRHHAVHLALASSTAPLRTYAFARAFFAAPDTTPIDRLLAELDEEEAGASEGLPSPWSREE